MFAEWIRYLFAAVFPRRVFFGPLFSDALTETYDSEFFLSLDRPCHYPPDRVHAGFAYRAFLGQSVNLD
ncbi:MAG: hypothetical protein JSU96_19840, partial [Acidobacteriota bacterium]